MAKIELVAPARSHLDGYIDALDRGWHPDHLRPAATAEQRAAIERDADAFLASFVDREARGGPITLPDGSQAPRLPGYRLWIWDGEFCGTIGLRWQRGSNELPDYVLGHIGYVVVPWKQRRGYATEALRLMLERARGEGLAYVEITTDPDNVASQRVIESNGATLLERFVRAPQYGATPALRYRVDLVGRHGT